jgi:alcohol dehydrogenase class IV
MNEIEKTFEIRTVPCKVGIRATEEIGSAIKKIKAKKVLILCGQTISKQTDIPAKVRNIIEEEKVEVRIWDKAEPEATMSSIEKAIDFIKGNEFDCFLGIGGGSTIAISKIVDLYSSFPKDFHDFLPPPLGKGRQIPDKIKPLILLPTTAGTGSEASEVAGFKFLDESGNINMSVISTEYFLPHLAVLDPLNTVTMPPQLTATTGLDALLIAIGSYTAKPYHTKVKTPTSTEKPTYEGSNPFSDILAEKSIELAGRYLRRSYANGYDLEAREGMLFAAHLAGLAAGKAGVHIAHAIAFSIGEKIHIDGVAGFTVAVTSPASLDFIASIVPRKMNRIGQMLRGEAEIHRSKIELSASEALKRLLKDLKCPNGISGLGFTEKDIPELSDRAFREQRLLAQSPRLVMKEDIEEILRASLRNW